MIKLAAFSYSGPPPKGYTCQNCKAVGVKLWREYNTFLSHQRLLCKKCIEAECSEYYKKLAKDYPETDQIGGMVPAVPTEDGTTFWGYTSVPPEGVDWWYRLPPVLYRPARNAKKFLNYRQFLDEWDSMPKADRQRRLDELLSIGKECCMLRCHKDAAFCFCPDCVAKLREQNG